MAILFGSFPKLVKNSLFNSLNSSPNFGRKYVGYVNFKSKDTSKNLFKFDFLMLGEGYNNNHHKHSSSPNFGGVRWHEIDITYKIMQLLNLLGIIQLKPSFLVLKREV